MDQAASTMKPLSASGLVPANWSDGESLLKELRELVPGYRLDRLVGLGGSSCVFTAYQQSLGREVAVKVLMRGDNHPEEIYSLLKREGRSIGGLAHPNIIRVIDSGIAAGWAYLVLEYVDAPTLADVLADGPLSGELAVQIAIQCASALVHAHRRGIVHRDIKPSNVLVDESGHAWLVDFGIASLSRANLDTRVTQATLAFAGSMPYMAPERMRGASEVSVTEDIYSLGAVLYEMLMGFPPQGAFPSVLVNGKEHGELDALVGKALAHEPSKRWESAADMLDALNALAGTSVRTAQAFSRQTDHTPRTLWGLLAAGGTVFISECFIIAAGQEERFSLTVGPGNKLYDDAIALIWCNAAILVCWTVVLWLQWQRCKDRPDAPSRAALLLCYLPIVFCISLVVILAVKD